MFLLDAILSKIGVQLKANIIKNIFLQLIRSSNYYYQMISEHFPKFHSHRVKVKKVLTQSLSWTSVPGITT